MSGLDARTLRVLTVAGASYIGRLAAMAAVLVTIPVARSALSPELFGVWMMLSGLLAFFAFADLGVGNSVLNRLTAAYARSDRAEIRRVSQAGYLCTGALGLVVLGIWLGWAWISSNPTSVVGDVPVGQRAEVLKALHVFAVLLALNIPAGLVQKIQLGMQAGHWVGMTQVCAALGMLVCIPAVRFLGGGLPGFVLASLGVQVLANFGSGLTWWLQQRRLRAAAPRALLAPGLDRHVVSNLLRTGSQFLVLQLAVAFGFQSDAIVIVHELGQAIYGEFAVVQRVFLASSSLLLAGMAGLWPAMGEALASGNPAWVKRTLLRSYVTVFLACGATCGLVATLMPSILVHWAGIHTIPPIALIIVLASWTLIDAMGSVSGAFMNAAGLLKAQVFVALLMGLLAFTGKWFLVGVLGPWGAVLATLLAYSATSVPMQIYLIRRRLRE